MESGVLVPDAYQLGPLLIKGKENIVSSGDGDIVLLPKVMTLLLYLCQHAQQVVSFDQLNQAIWPKEVVGDNAIYNLVGQLRKALGDSASKPTYIQTVSKMGYRLLLPAEPIQLAAKAITPQSETTHQEMQSQNPIAPQNPHQKNPLSRWLIPSVITVLVVGIALGMMLSHPTLFNINPTPPTPSQESQRQLKLAHYQLYRGDNQGVDQAITNLQPLAITYPQWQQPKLELAYAFLRKAELEPQQKEFWRSKAQAISSDISGINQGEHSDRQALAALLAAIQQPNQDLSRLKPLFSENSTLTSAKLAYSELLFQRGESQAAAQQLEQALAQCPDCPLLYRKYATAQMLLGEVQSGFEQFTKYRSLISRTSDSPIENVGNVPLTLANLKAMLQWQKQTPVPTKLLNHQRNTLALFYLTAGQIEAASAIVNTDATTSEQFFDLYTHAAIAGAKGDFNTSYALLKKRQQRYPNNPRFKLSVVYALWQLERYQEAMALFRKWQLIADKQVLAQSSNDPSTLPQSMPFSTWMLYAALLQLTERQKTEQQKTGEAATQKPPRSNTIRAQQILAQLEQQLRAGLLPGSQGPDIRLASVLALQGKTTEAIAELQQAIAQGWVSDFNQNWWYPQDAPYFRALRNSPEFKAVIAHYHTDIANITQAMTD